MSVAEQQILKQREFAFTNQDFTFLVEMVRTHTGIQLAEHKKDMVYGRVARRLRALGLRSVKDYCSLLSSPQGETEIMDFVNAVTTNLTRFFRESHHFDHLKGEVLKSIAAKPPSGKRLRIWSAGCSSGMEPYSIAMTVMDVLPNVTSWDCKILATDIDTNMLDKGSAGVYDRKDAETIPDSYQRRYVSVVESGHRDEIHMAQELRERVFFKQLNFLDQWPVKGPFDIIFCRNVLIYFDKELQQRIFSRFAELIRPGGFLYIGHSESISGNAASEFELLGKTIYRKKDGA